MGENAPSVNAWSATDGDISAQTADARRARYGIERIRLSDNVIDVALPRLSTLIMSADGATSSTTSTLAANDGLCLLRN